MRLDIAIVEQYWYSRNKAQAIIADGLVTVNEKLINKTSYDVETTDVISIASSPILKWVSRSAGKLEGFFQELWIQSLTWKTAIDIGSSTWGFTQILLAHDVERVISVDVGSEQLHEMLRLDIRVELHENTDIRIFSVYTPVSIVTIDVSFISLYEIVPVIERFIIPDADIYILYKPQFEVWKENLRKTGVPKDDTIVQKKLTEFVEFLWVSWYQLKKISKSTVVGEAGNQEYMMHIVRNNE